MDADALKTSRVNIHGNLCCCSSVDDLQVSNILGNIEEPLTYPQLTNYYTSAKYLAKLNALKSPQVRIKLSYSEAWLGAVMVLLQCKAFD